jgi:hypothetical protein
LVGISVAVFHQRISVLWEAIVDWDSVDWVSDVGRQLMVAWASMAGWMAGWMSRVVIVPVVAWIRIGARALVLGWVAQFLMASTL